MFKHTVAILSLTLGLVISVSGQAEKNNHSETRTKTLSFFANLETENFDAYLKRVRLPKVNAEFKAQVLARLAKEEIGKPSEKQQARLAALTPVLQYHERDSVLTIKVINAKEAFVGMQGRAVLFISENLLRLLSTAELQAVVAHELGHEYFWGEMMEARQQKQHVMMREIELRCDGIAVITMDRLGIEPSNLISALTQIRGFNARVVSTDARPYPENKERFEFIRAMSEMVKARAANERVIARNTLSNR